MYLTSLVFPKAHRETSFCFVNSGCRLFSHVPYHSLPHPLCHCSVVVMLLFPDRWSPNPQSFRGKCPHFLGNMLHFSQRKSTRKKIWVAWILRKAEASKSSCPVLVCQEPWLKLLEGTCMATYFPNANWSLRARPRVLPAEHAELMEHLASSCFPRPYIFSRRCSCLCWEQKACAFICAPCVTVPSARTNSQAPSSTGSWRCLFPFCSKWKPKL